MIKNTYLGIKLLFKIKIQTWIEIQINVKLRKKNEKKKKKWKYPHTVGTIKNLNIKLEERGKIDTLTHKYKTEIQIYSIFVMFPWHLYSRVTCARHFYIFSKHDLKKDLRKTLSDAYKS